MTDLSEFSWIDPDEVHLVKTPANGTPLPLLAKMAAEVDAVGGAVVKEFVDGLCGTERCSVCKERLVALSETQVAKAKMDAKERHSLSNSDFAFPKHRKEPLNDASHVRNAMSRFGQVEGENDADRKTAAHRIIARATELGIEVDPGSDVAQAAKQTAPDKSVPKGEALSQTDDHIEGDPTTGASNETQGVPPGAETRPSETTGQGDTAPDKALPTAEAESQTTKQTVDGTGDAAPNGDAEAADAKREAEVQTHDTHGAEKDAPGSPAWEHKDVALGEKAEHLISQLAEVVRTFTEREKAEGGASKGARRALAGIEYLTTHPQLLKEMADMPTDELTKALDELGAARLDAAKREKKDTKKAKAAKREKKAAKAAGKAAKAAGEPATDPRLEEALKAANEAKELVAKIAAEDGKRIVTNPEGLVAIFRGPNAQSAFKELEDRHEAAKAAFEKNPIAANQAEVQSTGFRLTAAKMIANENARAGQPAAMTRFGPGATPLLTNSRALPDDSAIRYH